MRAVVFTHGHCFDGLASAVLFTRLLSQLESARFEFVYRGCGYGLGQRHPSPSDFDGRENALLDYRFTPSTELGWFFDHHKTGFQKPTDREYFDAHRATRNYFFDADYGSCTKLIADTASTRFGLDLSDLAPLVAWANKVDSAAFESPDEAVDRTNPLLQLAAVVEQHGDDAFLQSLVPELMNAPVAEVAASTKIQDRYRPLGKKHDRFVQRVETQARREGRVVFVDMTESVLETVGKFVPYALFPECVYSVLVGRLRHGIKVSVGYNPWSGVTRDHDISAICARYGGGGHSVVGGIAFGSDDVERALEIARSIRAELNGGE